MSYWVYPEEKGEPVSVVPHMEGGTIQLGGCATASLSVTYNYAGPFRALGGLRTLDGMTVSDAIPVLEKAILELGIDRDEDYRAATPGNAGWALNILLTWAKANLDAQFRVSG